MATATSDGAKPRYDQTTFWGRLRHFVDVTDVRMMFVSKEEINSSVEMLKEYEKTKQIPNNDVETLWRAKKIKDAAIHPVTGEKIPLPLRASSFVPFNVAIAAGMLLPGASMATQVFWQWVNQSYNTMFNYANRNGTNTMSNEDLLKSYGGAVAVSCGAAIGLNVAFNKIPISGGTRNFVKMFVPFFSVAAANWSNVYLMRWNEIKQGIDVFDEEGTAYGKSKVAGQEGLLKVAVSRVLTPVPVMTLPPLFFWALNKTSLLKRYPRLVIPVNLGLIAACLGVGLPVAIALFPQVSSITASKLEPEFQQLRDASGKPITQLYYNKGI